MKTPAAEQWKKIGVRHHHGVVVPVFSLKGKDSSGVGKHKIETQTHWPALAIEKFSAIFKRYY